MQFKVYKTSFKMMNVYQACEVAKSYLERIPEEDVLVINTLFNFEKGVFFSFQAKEFIDTNNFNYLLVNGSCSFLS